MRLINPGVAKNAALEPIFYHAAHCRLGGKPWQSAATLVRSTPRGNRNLRGRAEPLGDCGVALIKVAAELERPIGVDERGLVDDENRNRLRQIAPVGNTGIDRLGDVVLG